MNELSHRQFELRLPMRFRTSRKKVTPVNLNVYRNLHFRSLTALKHMFQDHAIELLKKSGIPKLGRIRLAYQIFAQNKREFDISNICSIVDKFFSDSLTEAGIIEDDNYKILDQVSFGFGGYSAQEYVLVTITEIEPRKGTSMRILLDENEIQQALETFVFEALGTSGVTGVDLSADESGNITAELLMGDAERSTNTTPTPRKGRGGRPPGSKNKPKVVSNDVETPSDDSSFASDEGSDSDPDVEETNDDEGEDILPAKRSTPGKNLFGDEETESSESDSPDTKEDNPPAPTKDRKSSIFDQ